MDFDASNLLLVDGFVTDGQVLPPPAPTGRRLLFLGDSLTAGYGSGFDQPSLGPGASIPCGADVLISDAMNTYGAALCTNFTAECVIQAVSGITLMADQPNLPQIVNYTLGAMYPSWPAAQRVPVDWAGEASSAPPSAIVINLGENDAHHGNFSNPAFVAAFVSSYIDFVGFLVGPGAYNNPSLPIFATIGPHEAGQSVGILQAVAALTQQGINVTFLNATVPLPPALPAGCGGHPGPTIHLASAQRAYPVIKRVLGW